MYIQVAVARKLADSQDVLTYHVPESLQSQIRYGSMVHVLWDAAIKWCRGMW